MASCHAHGSPVGFDRAKFLWTVTGNALVTAGAIEGQSGRFAVKVPTLIETPNDVLKLPVVAANGASVVLGDLAEVRPTFKDATSITRIDGRPAIAIEITKRTGANLIETVDAV